MTRRKMLLSLESSARTATCWIRIQKIVSLLLLGVVTYMMVTSDGTDEMFWSGTVVTFGALLLAIATEGNPLQLTFTLKRAGLVNITEHQQSKIVGRELLINGTLHVLFGIILFIAGRYAAKLEPDKSSLMFIMAYVLTGLRFARMSANGTMGYRLLKSGVHVTPIVGHRDGAGGLSMIGNFFLRQVSALVIPAAWLIYWIISVAISRDTCVVYCKWVPFFFGLTLIVGVVFVIGLVLPMAAFRTMILEWESHKGREHSEYELATMMHVPISPAAMQVVLASVALPVVLSTASALFSRLG